MKLLLMDLHIYVTNPTTVTSDEAFDELTKLIEECLAHMGIDQQLDDAVSTAKLSEGAEVLLDW